MPALGVEAVDSEEEWVVAEADLVVLSVAEEDLVVDLVEAAAALSVAGSPTAVALADTAVLAVALAVLGESRLLTTVPRFLPTTSPTMRPAVATNATSFTFATYVMESEMAH